MRVIGSHSPVKNGGLRANHGGTHGKHSLAGHLDRPSSVEHNAGCLAVTGGVGSQFQGNGPLLQLIAVPW